MSLLRSLWILLLCVGAVMAQGDPLLMAVVDVQLKGAAKDQLTAEEKDFLSTAIRSQASQILGTKVEILSQAKFKKLVRANSEGCSEAGCFAGFIAEIGVDLGLQPTISYAFGKLNLTLEIADNRATIASRVLSAAPTNEGKNQLGQEATLAARELFTELAARLELEKPKKKKKKEVPVETSVVVPEESKPTPEAKEEKVPVVQEQTPVASLTEEAPQVESEPEKIESEIVLNPGKPMSAKRKWALVLLGNSGVFGAGGVWFNSKANGYFDDYTAAQVAWDANPSILAAKNLQDSYDNLDTAKTRRNASYAISVTSLVAAAVLWFWPED